LNPSGNGGEGPVGDGPIGGENVDPDSDAGTGNPDDDEKIKDQEIGEKLDPNSVPDRFRRPDDCGCAVSSGLPGVPSLVFLIGVLLFFYRRFTKA